ncbi:MAG: sigma-54 dependent transcriptional regulator [Thermodesulfovibrionales bacterium]
MKTALVYTTDDSLKKELAAALPKDSVLLSNSKKPGDAVVFIDLDTTKTSLISELSEKGVVVAVTRLKNTELAMKAVTAGAYETMQRPLRRDDLRLFFDEVHTLRSELKHVIEIRHVPPVPTCAIVGHSTSIMQTCKKLARLAQVEAPVLITGETGTGKELIAESIAQLSSRFGKPFVVVNCAAVPDNLLESELFGFEKGSFTGASAAKEGMLKIADEGSVFFDEIGEMPLALQGKLLRFLQTQAFYPLGSIREVQVNVRVISATNRDLAQMVREGTFREDLYHRLRVTTIQVPPLRERQEDIVPLVQFFVNRYRHTAPRLIRGVTKAFLKKMESYEWPGNIRELENIIRSGIALSKTPYLTTFELRELGEQSAAGRGGAAETIETISAAVIPLVREALSRKEKNIYEKIHAEVDKPLLDYILSYTKENQSEAARILGINRLTLRKKLKQ